MSQPTASGDVFGHVADGAEAPTRRPAWAPTVVATDVPSLDDVLDGTVDVAGTFRDKPKPPRSPKPPRTSRRTGGSRRDEQPKRSQPPVRQWVGEGGRVVGEQGRRAVRIARRRPTGVFARPLMLVAAAVGALVAGVGAGAGVDAVSGVGGGGGELTAAVTVAPVSPEACSAAQVAWARAAAAQVRMDIESPETLRTGFIGAEDALLSQTPPSGVADDWVVVLDYVSAMADAVADAEGDAVEAAVVTTLSTLDTEEMTAASQRVTAYLGADCSA